jgi:predicted RNA-binding protein YlxR (DUF448 family)
LKAGAMAEPVRTCLGCRSRRPQARLRRLALLRGPDGLRVVWDVGRTLGGRGAWLCADAPGCLTRALRKKALARAFRLEGELDAGGLRPEGGGRSL